MVYLNLTENLLNIANSLLLINWLEKNNNILNDAFKSHYDLFQVNWLWMMPRCCHGRPLSDPSRKVWFTKIRLESKNKLDKPEMEKMKKLNWKRGEGGGGAKATILNELKWVVKDLIFSFILSLKVKNGHFSSWVL